MHRLKRGAVRRFSGISWILFFLKIAKRAVQTGYFFTGSNLGENERCSCLEPFLKTGAEPGEIREGGVAMAQRKDELKTRRIYAVYDLKRLNLNGEDSALEVADEIALP